MIRVRYLAEYKGLLLVLHSRLHVAIVSKAVVRYRKNIKKDGHLFYLGPAQDFSKFESKFAC